MYVRVDFTQVTYKLLLQHWLDTSAGIADAAQRQAAMTNVPPWIQAANPHLTQDHYNRNRNQPEFLYKIAYICPAAAAQLGTSSMQVISETVRGPASSARTSGSPNNSGAADLLRWVLSFTS